jgi:hypothetical protein
MPQCQLGGARMIEEHIRYTFDMPATCGSHHRNGCLIFEPRVDRNESLCAASDQHARVIFYVTLFVPVMRREVEVPGLNQLVADSAHQLRVISIEKRNCVL